MKLIQDIKDWAGGVANNIDVIANIARGVQTILARMEAFEKQFGEDYKQYYAKICAVVLAGEDSDGLCITRGTLLLLEPGHSMEVQFEGAWRLKNAKLELQGPADFMITDCCCGQYQIGDGHSRYLHIVSPVAGSLLYVTVRRLESNHRLGAVYTPSSGGPYS